MLLDAVGFCGVDDSVSEQLEELEQLSRDHPWIEWGVLLRPELQGSPRYASDALLRRLGDLARKPDDLVSGARPFTLAAHFCGEDCLRVLRGETKRVQELHTLLNFRRMQINPTVANRAGGWEVVAAANGIREVAVAMPHVEIMLQVNTETEALHRELFKDNPPKNVSVLFDPSCGMGVAPGNRPPPIPNVHCGYAGGISPETVTVQLEKIAQACGDDAQPTSESVWIDMESGIRSVFPDGRDIFDLARIRKVLDSITRSTCAVLPGEKQGNRAPIDQPIEYIEPENKRAKF